MGAHPFLVPSHFSWPIIALRVSWVVIAGRIGQGLACVASSLPRLTGKGGKKVERSSRACPALVSVLWPLCF